MQLTQAIVWSGVVCIVCTGPTSRQLQQRVSYMWRVYVDGSCSCCSVHLNHHSASGEHFYTEWTSRASNDDDADSTITPVSENRLLTCMPSRGCRH